MYYNKFISLLKFQPLMNIKRPQLFLFKSIDVVWHKSYKNCQKFLWKEVLCDFYFIIAKKETGNIFTESFVLNLLNDTVSF